MCGRWTPAITSVVPGAGLLDQAIDQEMFNLTVSEAHTYYVGQQGWLVHNASGPYERQTDAQLRKSASTYQSLVDEHIEKLETYRANPDASDNKGLLKNASPDVRQKIIDGRIKSIEQQIKKQQGELAKVLSEIARRGC